MESAAENASVLQLQRAIQERPNDPELQRNLALLTIKLGRLDIAEQALRAATVLQPGDAASYNDLGTVYKKLERYDEAEQSLRRALQLQPNSAESHYNLANVLTELERADEARRHLQRALEIQPAFAFAWHKLGNYFRKREEYAEARSCYTRAIKIDPNFVQPIFSLGLVCQAEGELKPALRLFKKAHDLAGHLPKPYVALSNILFELGEYEAAMNWSHKALEVKPGFAPAWSRIGDIFGFYSRAVQAIDAYENALKADPKHMHAQYSLTFIRAMLCDWSHRDADIDMFKQIATDYVGQEHSDDTPSVSPLHLNYFDFEPEVHLGVGCKYADLIERRTIALRDRLQFNHDRPREGKLRIGYISPDFRTHAVNTILHEMYRHHDRDKFTIYAYSLVKPEDNNFYRDNVINGVDVFADINQESHEASARRIYDDRIDVLIDLGGYTTHARPEIGALRAAPVQAQYLGYLDTMGADWIDYVIGDESCLPRELEAGYREKFIWLPNAVGCSTMRLSDKPMKRADFGLPEDAFVFCNLNAPYKIDPQVFDVWCRLLKAVPNGVLWLQDMTNEKQISANLRREAAARGIDPARLVFADKMPLDEHNARFALADLFIDTFAFGAGATAVGALMSIPLLARLGDRFAQRLAGSIVRSAGLPELVCTSDEEYLEKAIHYATDSQAYSRLRSKVHDVRGESNLYNMPHFVASMEQACTQMFNRWRDGAPLEHLKI